MGVRLVITQEHEKLADIPDYSGPIPRAGDYITHPSLGIHGQPGVMGCVKLVQWSILSRPVSEKSKAAGLWLEAAHHAVTIVL
jgi:hypothetical protein